MGFYPIGSITPTFILPVEGEGSIENVKKHFPSPGGCVVMSFRGESRGILNLQLFNNKRFLASLEMTEN
jgi:hypothetical protein